MPRYAELVYNGFWFSPERRALQAAIDETQKYCTGTVRVKLYKVRVLAEHLLNVWWSDMFSCSTYNVAHWLTRPRAAVQAWMAGGLGVATRACNLLFPWHIQPFSKLQHVCV